MTKQAAFNRVWKWFVVEGHSKSSTIKPNGEDRCLYRAPDGRKCAVGVLLPDSAYREEYDQETYSNDLALAKIARRLRLAVGFLRDLQRAHDLAESLHFRSAIQKNLENTARQYHLTVPR